jgi:hypothetical protein
LLLHLALISSSPIDDWNVLDDTINAKVIPDGLKIPHRGKIEGASFSWSLTSGKLVIHRNRQQRFLQADLSVLSAVTGGLGFGRRWLTWAVRIVCIDGDSAHDR